MTPMLEFRNVDKSFFGVRVLKNVSFSIPQGSILGIVGENGAGKSTMMNLLGGNLRADAGEIILAGEPLKSGDPRESEGRGIAFIHQELNLFPNLTVAENLFLTRFPSAKFFPWVKRRELEAKARSLLNEVGLRVSPGSLAENLSPGEQQLLEVAKALSFEARLIIFDEPTTSLTFREIETLFALVAKLHERGITLIYITHTLPDVFRLCDDLLVLRDGEVVAQGPAASFSTEKLISLMVGRTLDQVFPARLKPPSKEVLLRVRDLSRAHASRKISFDLHAGEVLGVAGLMGAGRTELARVLFGLARKSSGDVVLLDGLVRRFTPGALIRAGMAFLTEDRRSEGLCMDGSIAENLALVALPDFSRNSGRLVSRNRIAAAIQHLREKVRLDLKARDDQRVRTLSGGNQQKVVLGKWLLRQPKILILDEPTRGVDVGARSEIYRLINELAADGVSILLISSEIEELIGLSDRILVMKNGGFVNEIARENFDREQILRSALGTA